MSKVKVVNLHQDTFGPFSHSPMPNTISPALMKRLLGGRFPKTGFSWDCVKYFKCEKDGSWQPYNGFNEILPAVGFRIKAEVEE